MFLTTFDVLKKENGQKIKEKLYLKTIEDKDLDDLYDFMLKVKNSMPDSKNLSIEPRDQIFIPYEMGAQIFALYNKDGEIVGERYISLLSHGKSDYALDLGFTEEDANNIIYLKSTVIDLRYTGNGLQYKTLEFLKDFFEHRGYKRIMSTISPYNLFSLKNALKTGLKIRALEKKYKSEEHPEGLWRFLLYLDESKEETFEENIVYVNRENLKEQSKLLESGYVGILLSEDGKKIGYSKNK